MILTRTPSRMLPREQSRLACLTADRYVASQTVRDIIADWRFGHDTVTIAQATGLHESDVCRVLHTARDERHAARARRVRA